MHAQQLKGDVTKGTVGHIVEKSSSLSTHGAILVWANTRRAAVTQSAAVCHAMVDVVYFRLFFIDPAVQQKCNSANKHAHEQCTNHFWF